MEDKKKISSDSTVTHDGITHPVGPVINARNNTDVELFNFAKRPQFLNCKDCAAWEATDFARNKPAIVGDCFRHPKTEKDKPEESGCFDGIPKEE